MYTGRHEAMDNPCAPISPSCEWISYHAAGECCQLSPCWEIVEYPCLEKLLACVKREHNCTPLILRFELCVAAAATAHLSDLADVFKIRRRKDGIVVTQKCWALEVCEAKWGEYLCDDVWIQLRNWWCLRPLWAHGIHSSNDVIVALRVDISRQLWRTCAKNIQATGLPESNCVFRDSVQWEISHDLSCFSTRI